jgi:hypothetical protein
LVWHCTRQETVGQTRHGTVQEWKFQARFGVALHKTGEWRRSFVWHCT